MNIVDYVRKNKATFAEQPLNEVDSLVFAEVAYFNFRRSESQLPKRTLGELTRDAEYMTAGTLSILRRHNLQLVKALNKSPRFAPVEVGFARSRSSDSKEERFAAVTFRTGENSWHISYRGTGVSLVGWKENLKMALMLVIPTQRIALDYLTTVASRVSGSLTLGGLSKGGNLSVFAATYAPDSVKERISAVYNHDGPGFKEGIFDDPRYLSVADRIHKTVPHDSIVGMLLNTTHNYEVVDSVGVSIKQHDPFTWVVKDNYGFKKLPQTTRTSKVTDAALTKWLSNMDERTRRRFVYAVFAIVEGSGAREVGDFLHRPLRKIRLMRKAYDALQPSDRELIAHGGKQLLSLWFGDLFALAKRKK